MSISGPYITLIFMFGSQNGSTILMAILLVGIGFLMLASNFGLVTFNFDILRYWPGILIYFGCCNILKYLFGFQEKY